MVKTTKKEKGGSGNHYDLPQQRVLFISRYLSEEKTTFKIFSINDLNNSLVEKTFNKKCKFLSIVADGSILIYAVNARKLIKLDSNLAVLSKQDWIHYPIAVIDNESFFLIRVNKHALELSVYKWEKESYVEVHNETLQSHAPILNKGIEGIKFLGGNRYCAISKGFDFYALIFELQANYTVKELGVIKPEGYLGCGNNEITILPTGELLIYNSIGNKVQIWDTETFHCIKEWQFHLESKGNLDDDFKAHLRVVPFPDSPYLLVQKKHFYLFHMNTSVLKQIRLTYQPLGVPHVLPNGQVLAFIQCSDDFVRCGMFFAKAYLNHCKIICFELPEIRSHINSLPRDAKKEEDSNPIDDEQGCRCLCM